MKFIWKKLSLSLAVLAPFVLVILWMFWDIGILGNYGLESGYYGEFNRIKHVLDEMPHVKVTNHWQHHDVTLEDFGFDLLVDNNRSVRINYWDHSEQQDEQDKKKIRAFIEEQIAAQP